MIAETLIFREGETAPALHITHALQKTPLAMRDVEDFPAWAKLSCYQCPECPLDNSCPWCPAAVSIAAVIRACASWDSKETVRLIVSTDDRQVIQACSAKDALSSVLLDQIIHSTCPRMQFDFWFWKFFSESLTIENMLFRRLAIDLICRDFSDTKKIEFTASRISTDELASILACLTKRILSTDTIQCDAAPNALSKLASLSTYSSCFQDEIYDHIEAGLNEHTATQQQEAGVKAEAGIRPTI